MSQIFALKVLFNDIKITFENYFLISSKKSSATKSTDFFLESHWFHRVFIRAIQLKVVHPNKQFLIPRKKSIFSLEMKHRRFFTTEFYFRKRLSDFITLKNNDLLLSKFSKIRQFFSIYANKPAVQFSNKTSTCKSFPDLEFSQEIHSLKTKSGIFWPKKGFIFQRSKYHKFI